MAPEAAARSQMTVDHCATPPPSVAVTASRVGRSPGRRFHGAVVQKLGTELVAGRYGTDAIVGGEVALARELDISRSAVREAIQILASKGLVESCPGKGMRVLPRDRWNILDPDVVQWAFSGPTHIELARDIFELRLAIEPDAAALAAMRRTTGDLVSLRSALADMRGNALASQVQRQAEYAFHDAILRATDNKAMLTFVPAICGAVQWASRMRLQGPGLPGSIRTEHILVCEAIASKDAQAASQHMRQLIALECKDAGIDLIAR